MAKESKRKRTVLEGMAITSILELTPTNVWKLSEQDIKRAWESEVDTECFLPAEDKLINTIRVAFEVVHYDPKNNKEKEQYENGEWQCFQHCNTKKGWVAIRKKHITRLNDLNYENIFTVTPSALLELIDRNFGGGWDSVSLSLKDIILTAFDVSTAVLPEKRMHMQGGTLDKKIAQGFEVLEIQKGTWIEAIFVKKKEPNLKPRMNKDLYDEEGNLRRKPLRITDEDGNIDTDEEEDLPNDQTLNDEEEIDDSPDDEQLDENFYSSYTEEATVTDTDTEDLEGLSIEEE